MTEGEPLENPVGEVRCEDAGLAPRLDSLEGKRALFLSNAQQAADELLARTGQLLLEKYGLAAILSARRSEGHTEELPPADFVIGGVGL
ncbi:MAG: hypothetical protein HYX92_06705 [Chloroflexi bacterium]|nr:hypothetical protein [Chloroflexota bacterium]